MYLGLFIGFQEAPSPIAKANNRDKRGACRPLSCRRAADGRLRKTV